MLSVMFSNNINILKSNKNSYRVLNGKIDSFNKG